jgi:hypothetical protein
LAVGSWLLAVGCHQGGLAVGFWLLAVSCHPDESYNLTHKSQNTRKFIREIREIRGQK